MIFEKWPMELDVFKLQEHLEKYVLPKEISRQSESFGGWSVLSGNGEITDGWQKGHLLLTEESTEAEKAFVRNQIKLKFSEYKIETEICTGYLQYVIERIRSSGLSPYRARIICLSAKGSSSWHSDDQPNRYAVRLHIPIITNEFCFFETRKEREHIPADGSGYFVYVNREHRVVNDGNQNRYHLVVDVKDVQQVSKFHRFEDFMKSNNSVK